MQPVAIMNYCLTCGTDLRHLKDHWPKPCPNASCRQVHYHPVLTVVLCLVYGESGGPLIIQRGNEPGKGGWAFPGGYQDYGETVETAAVREVFEEVGIRVDPSRLWYFGAALSNTGNKSLVFFAAFVPDLEAQPRHLSPDETLDCAIATPGAKLVFPSHQEMLIEFFAWREAQARS